MVSCSWRQILEHQHIYSSFVLAVPFYFEHQGAGEGGFKTTGTIALMSGSMHFRKMQGHEKALEKLPSRVAAIVPKEQYFEAMEAAGLRSSNSRFINFAELASIEALQVMDHYLADVRHNQFAKVVPNLVVTYMLMVMNNEVQDAEWEPASEAEHRATGVAIGSGLSCTTDLAEAGVYVSQGLIRK